MSSLSRELVFLILQFLDEEKFKETVHRYGIQESSSPFSLSVFFMFDSVSYFSIFPDRFSCLDCERLEQESGVFFNIRHFEEAVLAGDWDEVERYLSGFTKLDDNRYSMKIFFEIRKQKYLEALDR